MVCDKPGSPEAESVDRVGEKQGIYVCLHGCLSSFVAEPSCKYPLQMQKLANVSRVLEYAAHSWLGRVVGVGTKSMGQHADSYRKEG